MNKILHACGLESRARWIQLEPRKFICSSCGNSIRVRSNYSNPPKVCPECKSEMKEGY